jgi:hypothetical protein
VIFWAKLRDVAYVYIYPVRLLVYHLYEKGCPLNYGQVLTRSKLVGTLVYEKADRANQVARLYREDGWQIAELRRAVVVRISSGCMLLRGFEKTLDAVAPAQTWLCALTQEQAKEALMKIRPPRPEEDPFGDFEGKFLD